ncbi:hypothetical protein AJ87_41590 [Rhizobium yanglingense]|nr:hypothetical protein AJ87_41590 [Rhizobium yanglingense]
MSKADRIQAVLSIVDEAEYDKVTTKLASLFGLEYNFGKAHKFGIKTIIKSRVFDFSDGISLPSRLFMILHTLGHYYFISRADKMGIDRYKSFTTRSRTPIFMSMSRPRRRQCKRHASSQTKSGETGLSSRSEPTIFPRICFVR